MAAISDWDNKRKCYYGIGVLLILTLIVIAVCLATIDYDWDQDDEQTAHHHGHKDQVNLSVHVDVGPGQSVPQPIEMSAPEGVHRDMALDRPGTQYFAGPVKVMTDEERIRYERMMNPVPKSFPEFMDNQKYIVHVMDFHNLVPPTSRQELASHSNQEEEAEEDEDDEDADSESGILGPLDRSVSQASDLTQSIPSDFLTQQFLDSVRKRKSEQESTKHSDRNSGRIGQQSEKKLLNQSGREKSVINEGAKGNFRQSLLNQGSKRRATPFAVRDRNLDDLFVQADRNIEEIAQMKQTANFLLTSIGRMLIQKAAKQQQKQPELKTAVVAHQKSPEAKAETSTESDSKLDHLLDVADQDIAQLTQKTNQTDRLMDLISETLSSSMGQKRKDVSAPTLEQKEGPTPQHLIGDNFPFLPFFSPISIQRKENGKPFGTEKPAYLYLGQPVVHAVHSSESSTSSSVDETMVPAFTLIQPPAFNGKPLDDHPDDPESGDVAEEHEDQSDDEDDEPMAASTQADRNSDPGSETQKTMVREKRVSKPGMFKMGRND